MYRKTLIKTTISIKSKLSLRIIAKDPNIEFKGNSTCCNSKLGLGKVLLNISLVEFCFSTSSVYICPPNCANFDPQMVSIMGNRDFSSAFVTSCHVL